ncbi:AsmA family protein [Vogesella sp. LIG4]|uniref:AsmA family protein n=1 Tax=Vogesella sp. LIG4 TaxID=1192162 RepID=UPI00081FD06D|nr:AsmA family protein [Vogesella sp. LIG4]SCK17859.1 AsmA protein [Vogesella sp. LIG4]
MKWNSGRLWLKVSVYTVLLFATVLAMALTLFFLRFDSQSVRVNLQRSLDDTQRTVTINGSVLPMVFPSPGLSLGDVSISDPGSKNEFARIGKIQARLAWMPLLFGDLQITHLELHDSTFHLLRETDGSLNFADLLRRRKPSRFKLDLDTMALRGTTILLSDRVNGINSKLEEGSLDVTGLHSEANLSFGGRLASGNRVISLAMQAPFTRQDDQISIDQLSALAISSTDKLGEVRLKAEGKLKLNFGNLLASGENLKLTLDTSQPKGHAEALLPAVNASLSELTTPAASINGSIDYARTQYRFNSQLADVRLNHDGAAASQLQSQLSWQVGAHSLNMTLHAPLSLANYNLLRLQPLTLSTQLKTPALPRGQLQASLGGELDGDLNESRLNLRVSGQLDGAALAATATQYGFVSPRHEVTLSVGKLDLNRYLPENQGAETVALFKNGTPFHLDWMDFFDLNGKLNIGELSMGRFRIRNIGADVSVRPETLALDNLSADIYDGSLKGSLHLLRDKEPRLQVSQQLLGMQIRPLMQDLFDFSRVEGAGNGWVQLDAHGNSLAALRNNLNGKVAVRLEKGALTGIDLASALRNLPTELKDWNMTARADQKTTFSALSAAFELQNGVARSQDLKLASSLVDVNGGGKIDLPQNIVDYTLNVRANPKAFTRLGGVNIPLKITGPINQPVYALDFNSIVKGKKTQGEKQQALKQELKNQINGILPLPGDRFHQK